MAVGKKFPDFPLAGNITGQEFLIGYNADATSEIRTSVQSIIDAVEVSAKDEIVFENGSQVTSKTISYIAPTGDTTLDTIDLSKFSSVKYIVDIRNASAFCTAETLVTSFSGVSYMTTYAVLGDESLMNLMTTISGDTIYLKNAETLTSGLTANITGMYSR